MKAINSRVLILQLATNWEPGAQDTHQGHEGKSTRCELFSIDVCKLSACMCLSTTTHVYTCFKGVLFGLLQRLYIWKRPTSKRPPSCPSWAPLCRLQLLKIFRPGCHCPLQQGGLLHLLRAISAKEILSNKGTAMESPMMLVSSDPFMPMREVIQCRNAKPLAA